MKYVVLGALILASPVSAACSPDGLCEVPQGSYQIAVPDNVENPPMVLWLHGFGGTGASAMRSGGMAERFVARGYAFASADGLEIQHGMGQGQRSWSFQPDGSGRRDEIAFFAAIVADAVAEYGVDPERVILSGFSVGGSMVSYVACADQEIFDAYAPIAGAFWKPHPETCAGPVQLFHTHGWSDNTVPLEGRVLGNGAIEQGDVWYTMSVWREVNGCISQEPNEIEIDDAFWRRSWTECVAGSLQFALHDGGHGVPQGWSAMMLDWYEGLPQ